MTIEEYSSTICNLLKNSSFYEEAQEIDSLTNIISCFPKGEEKRRKALQSLISRCHPKWLGDYYITGVDYIEWTRLLTNFKAKLKKELDMVK